MPRKFFVLADVAKAPLALEAVRRIDAIFDAERALNGVAEDQRLALRKEHAAPVVGELEAWMRSERGRLSRHNDVAKAMDYMLKRWAAASSTTGRSACRTTPPNGRSAGSPSAGATGCSRVPIAAASGQLRSTP